MARFISYDGTQIGYRTLGDGSPLVCLPGGPGRTCEYFGDLGGLSRSRQLIMPDTRGTGESADASDPLSYRCNRLAGDVEALRAHLGLDRNATVTVQPGAAHFPWLDDPAFLTAAITSFLGKEP
jgi:pimeloyl-ACP methyl ester carboxylesterase